MYAPWQNEAPHWQFIDDNLPPFLDLAGDNVVMLVGSGRSGTTWVQNLINYRQDHRVLFEPFWREKVPFLPNLPSAHLYLRPEDPALHFRPAAMRILSGQLYTPWTDRRRTPVIYRRRLIKEIRAHLMLKWLVTQMPSLKIVFLLRHPCAVSHSLVKLGWPRDRTTLAKMCRQPTLLADFLSPFAPLIEATKNPFEKNILLWAVQNYVALKQFGLHPADLPQAAAAPHRNQIALFFYEELCTNPEAELPRLFNFLQLPLRDEVAAAWSKPSWTSTQKSAVMTGESLLDAWRSEVTSQQIERAVALLQPFGLDQVYNTDSMPCYPDRMKRACDVRAEVSSLSSTVSTSSTSGSTSSTSVSTNSINGSTSSTGALMNGEPPYTMLSPAMAAPGCTKLTTHCTTWLGDTAGARPACCTAHLKELLFFAHDLLTEYGIAHWLDFGALLGAVRHQALNPWDDHVDMAFLDSEPSLLLLLMQLFQDAGYPVQYDPEVADELTITYSTTNQNHLKLYAYQCADGCIFHKRRAPRAELWRLPAHFLESMAPVTLYDRTFLAPAPLHDFLVNHRYGPSYPIPLRALDQLAFLFSPTAFTPTVGALLQDLAQLLQIRGQWERQIQASALAQATVDAFSPPAWPLGEDRLARLIGKSYQPMQSACAGKLEPFWQSLHRTNLLDKRVRRKYHTTLSDDEITPAVYLLLYYIAQEKARVQTLTKMAGVICE